MFHSKSGLYISPSDSILSPASQKLAGFKQKQINKQCVLYPQYDPRILDLQADVCFNNRARNKMPAARTLFARTPSSCSSGGFDDVDGGEEKA